MIVNVPEGQCGTTVGAGCIKRERTDRGTTFTLPGGSKISFSDVSRSALHEALEKLYTLERAMDEGRLVLMPRMPREVNAGG